MDKHAIVFIDDILIYSSSFLEHEQYLRVVLQTLRDHWLYVKLNKCEFLLNEVVFLRHVTSTNGIFMDLKKVEVILNWKKPMNVTEIQSFLSLTSYYKRFIKGFSIIATSVTLLTRKEVKFKW